MTMFSREQEEGVAVVWLDYPDSKVNKLSSHSIEAMRQLLDDIENDASITAVVLVSKKEDFIVGADLEEIRELSDPAQIQQMLQEGHQLLKRLANFPKPVVAAMHGAVMGGGLEVALACHYRLASNAQQTKFSFPEVTLGLLPGAGGTQRLPQLVGLQKALEIMLTGKTIYPRAAKSIGLVDALIHKAGLLAAGKEAARLLVQEGPQRKRDKQGWRQKLIEHTPLNRLIYQRAEENVLKRTSGHYPAPLAIIECVRIGQEKGQEAGLAAEIEHFSRLLFSTQAKALIHLFFAKTKAEKNHSALKLPATREVGVLGAGLMGSGIAQLSAQAGCEVMVKDLDLETAARAKKVIYQELSKRVPKAMSAFERDKLVERVQPVSDFAALAKADVVIEAVLESEALKRQLLAELEKLAEDDQIFASNTSAIPITRIAQGARRPENIVGMHYFSPAQKMPLLEIITTEQTSAETLSRVVDLGLKQGKTIIVVGDGPGFYTTRILAFYINEALQLLAEGGDIGQIDAAMKGFGFPVGPFVLLDEVGIDVGAKIIDVLADLFVTRGVDAVVSAQEAVTAGLKGKKSGLGFYRYERGKKEVNRDIYQYFAAKERKTLDVEQIQQRLVLMMVNEALYCLEEGILASALDGDVGAVFGLGFPPFLGGPFWYLDQLGSDAAVTALEALQLSHGDRFKPAPPLLRYRDQGRSFYASAPAEA